VLPLPPAARNALAPRRAERDRDALTAFAATRDPELRERLVERYLPLARFAASRFASRREPFEDLFQVASLALVRAIDRYDPEKASSFSSYALPTMLGELRRYFRDRGWAVRPPRGLQEQALVVEHAIQELRTTNGATPTVQEVAAATASELEDVLEALQALAGRHAASIDAPRERGEDGDAGIVERSLGAVDDGFDRAEDRVMLDAMLQRLTPREREILHLRFDDDLTQAEIGRRIGLSQMHVSRILRASIEKVREDVGVAA
jgi:RNA polymerase sigma-B factor